MKNLLPCCVFPVVALAFGCGALSLHAEEISAEASIPVPNYSIRTIDGDASFTNMLVLANSGNAKHNTSLVFGFVPTSRLTWQFPIKVPSGRMAEVAVTFNWQESRYTESLLVLDVNGKNRYVELGDTERMSFSSDATVCVSLTSTMSMRGKFSLTAKYSDVQLLPMKADLKVSSFVVSPTTASASEPLNIEFTVANVGLGDAQATRASILNDLENPNSFLAAFDVPAIAANNAATVKQTLPAGTLPVGTHNLYIRADLLNVILG